MRNLREESNGWKGRERLLKRKREERPGRALETRKVAPESEREGERDRIFVLLMFSEYLESQKRP